MAIEDSNPERRNLVGASLAFIAYFYGGGVFTDGAVTLHVVSIKFAHTGFLTALAWAALFWFFYRYWLLHSGSFRKGFSSEIYDLRLSRTTARHLQRATGYKFLLAMEEDKPRTGWNVDDVRWRGGCLRARYLCAEQVQWGRNGAVETYAYAEPTRTKAIEYAFSSLTGWWFSLSQSALILFKRRSFSDYLVPYLLFVAALLGPLFKALT